MIQNQKNGTNFRKQKLDPDINGMAGEIAVAKYFNRFPDLSVGPHRRGYDLIITGRKVVVKTTTYNPGYLQCKTYKKIQDADIYLLVSADMPHYTIQGGATSHDLLRKTNIKDMKGRVGQHGGIWMVITQNSLVNGGTLWRRMLY